MKTLTSSTDRLSHILLDFSSSDVDGVVSDQTISDVGPTFIPVEKHKWNRFVMDTYNNLKRFLWQARSDLTYEFLQRGSMELKKEMCE